MLENVITENSLFELYGKQKSGKTFWALALSLSIACGLDFYGRKAKHGKALYIVGEGNKVRFGHRIKAWVKRTSQLQGIPEKELRARIDKNWELVPIPVMISMPQQVSDFLAANKAEGLRVLIVIDTLMRTFDGNINEQNDMMRYVRGCDEIREATGAAVLIVHHPGLAASKSWGRLGRVCPPRWTASGNSIRRQAARVQGGYAPRWRLRSTADGLQFGNSYSGL